ncbi:iron-containing alcohol dehydrogenase [Vibrio methylphosphonaticus]|uniref:iron-containing alcohol dehydrogenase n=1 Tax=Vibrio methylphosphonaticus TaxID=2946866 RepID=UPI00202AB449|nr:iron-containing alcohol dehydrogenase [Vibrio methylphosphonaticus]MCL9775878.1 iron-containing alcohol dehydrogenase [Vibrio methylphosphonaticus]
MNNFTFNLRTVIHSGSSSIEAIPTLFKAKGAQRVLLISDQGLESLGFVARLASLFNHNDDVKLAGIYTDVEADASCLDINRALEFAKQVNADSILALGGGSVIDASKGIKYGLEHKLDDIRDAIQGGGRIEVGPEVKPFSIPHIGVPTTAGTGAEASPIAVFYNDREQVKASLVVSGLECDIAVLDPELTVNLPVALTVSTGMDALTHAIEALASPMSNAFTDAYAIQACRLILNNLPKVLHTPQNMVARGELLQASTMAISAFYSSLGGIPIHNCAHAFGAIAHIPHGDANSVLLPVVIEALPEFYLSSISKLASVFDIPQNLTDKEKHQEVVHSLRAFQTLVNATQNFAKWNLDDTTKQQIVIGIEKDISFQFYPIAQDKVTAILASTC